MDPMRLRLLRELDDRGSVSAVAAALHVSASAVSQQLAILQADVPVPLTVKQGVGWC
jgi:DNA-binding transcriptional LysR family regulator